SSPRRRSFWARPARRRTCGPALRAGPSYERRARDDRRMNPQADLLFWMLARVTGLAAFLAIAVALLSGVALRTSVFDRLGANRAWLELHTFSTVLWLPLGGMHLLTLLVDKTAQIAPIDLVLPFGVIYGPTPIGLGTIALDTFVLVTVTGWLKRQM